MNVLSGNALAKAYLPKMLAQDFGRIIFIASEEAVMPSGEMPQYSMTKTMNLSLAKSLSNLTVGTHVTVNTVMPGSTLTEGVEKMLEDMYADSDIPKEDWEKDFMKIIVLVHKSNGSFDQKKLVVLLPLWPARILLLSQEKP